MAASGLPSSSRCDPRAATGSFAWWREEVCNRFLPLDVQQRGPGPFAATIDLVDAGDVRLSRIGASGQVVRRHRRQIAAGSSGELYVLLQRCGTGIVVAGGHASELTSGDVAFIDTERPYELIFPERFEQWCLTLPGARIGRRMVTTLPHGRPWPAETSLAEVLRLQCETLDRHGDAVSPIVRARIGETLLELVDSTLEERGARVPRPELKRQALLRLIDDGYRDVRLSPAKAARTLGISVRSVHALLVETGDTFAGRLRARRVAHASHLLSNAAVSGWSIARIAHEAGFADVSTFNRAFRSHHGTTPGRFREERARVASPAASDA